MDAKEASQKLSEEINQDCDKAKESIKNQAKDLAFNEVKSLSEIPDQKGTFTIPVRFPKKYVQVIDFFTALDDRTRSYFIKVAVKEKLERMLSENG